MDKEIRKLRACDAGRLSVFAVVWFFALEIAGLAVALSLPNPRYLATGKVWADVLLALASLAAGLFAHEGLHAAGCAIFGGAKARDIEFGFDLKAGMAHCHCSKPLSGSAYVGALALPCLIVGVAPYAICAFFGGLILTSAFAMHIAGSAADVALICKVIKNRDARRRIVDHPSLVGYYVFLPAEPASDPNARAETDGSGDRAAGRLSASDPNARADSGGANRAPDRNPGDASAPVGPKECDARICETAPTPSGEPERSSEPGARAGDGSEILSDAERAFDGGWAGRKLGMKVLLIAIFLSGLVLALFLTALAMKYA